MEALIGWIQANVYFLYHVMLSHCIKDEFYFQPRSMIQSGPCFLLQIFSHYHPCHKYFQLRILCNIICHNLRQLNFLDNFYPPDWDLFVLVDLGKYSMSNCCWSRQIWCRRMAPFSSLPTLHATRWIFLLVLW
jgi:hypothetical protein